MEQRGWREDLAERAAHYLELAQAKSPRDPRVLSGKEAYKKVATKYGIAG
jgi:hypothetical protein